jgi:hypothetical protein
VILRHHRSRYLVIMRNDIAAILDVEADGGGSVGIALATGSRHHRDEVDEPIAG